MKYLTWILVLLAVLCIPAFGQPSVRLTTVRAVQGDANARLTLHVLCDGMVQYTLSEEQLYITDNGLPVEDLQITEHPSAVLRSQISAALVLDASGSMSGTGNAGTKAAANAFISYLDGTADEAAVLWFTSAVTTMQQMTSSKLLLQGAVDLLPASGATAAWDGAYAGVELVANSGTNPKRAVLLLSDGQDNSSTRTPAEIVVLAQYHDIRVFTIGLGSNISASEMQMIALLTGGQYFQTPNASQLQAIFSSVASFMGRGFDEHVVAYRSPDPGAAQHHIVAHVAVCNEEVESQRTEASLLVSSIDQPSAAARPDLLSLGVNAPNPFAPGTSTSIPYEIRGSGVQHVRLQVFDLLGRRVSTLVDRALPPGQYRATFTATSLARGAYLYRITSGRSTQSRFMLVH